jgi:hypothetical protein
VDSTPVAHAACPLSTCCVGGGESEEKSQLQAKIPPVHTNPTSKEPLGNTAEFYLGLLCLAGELS